MGARITLLDGGMGQELIRRSSAPPHPLWSARVMLQSPEIVAAAHADYVAAGAKVLTVNSYTCTQPRLAAHGYAHRLAELQELACRLAREAADAGEGVAVAGCLPPLVASYLKEAVAPFEACLTLYRELAASQAPHVDLILAETMTTPHEARAAAIAGAETGLPVWVSWTLADSLPVRLRSGASLAEAHAALEGVAVAGRLLNCSFPEVIAEAMPELVAMGGPVGAYANGFTSIEGLKPGGTVAALDARDDLGPEEYAAFALGWAEAGATLIGGCCEVGPAHIAETARALGAAGYEIGGLA